MLATVVGDPAAAQVGTERNAPEPFSNHQPIWTG